MTIRILCALCAVTFCLLPGRAFETLPPQLDGSMMPYDFESCSAPQVPDSLHPFHIEYTARHGARFLSSAAKTRRVASALAQARVYGTLTPLGEEMQALLDRVDSVTAGRWGALDSLGMAEQEELARQMSAMWPQVLSHGPVQASATWVPRVVMSMYAFCHEAVRLNPDLEVTAAEGHRFDPLLRFWDTDAAYSSYLAEKPWHTLRQGFISSHVSPRPARALVGDIMDDKGLRALTLDIYGVLQSLRAAGLPAPDTRWMDEAEYRACWGAADLEHYYARSVNALSAEPAVAAIPLLRDIIESADRAAAACLTPGAEPMPAVLRFGHAETLMPLAALMDLQGCCVPDAPADRIPDLWRDWEIVPLGSNIELVLFLSDSGRIYALTRLNGRDTPLRGQGSALLPWPVMRALLTARADTLQTQDQ